MPRDMTMKSPQARIVRFEADQRPTIRVNRQGVSPQWVRYIQPRLIGGPVESPRPLLHDPEHVPMQMEGVRALVQAVDEEVDDLVIGVRDDELARVEGGAKARGAEAGVVFL